MHLISIVSFSLLNIFFFFFDSLSAFFTVPTRKDIYFDIKYIYLILKYLYVS